MAVATKETVKRDARDLVQLVDEAVERSPLAELAAIRDVLQQALTALRTIRSRPATGAYEAIVPPERRQVYFPESTSRRGMVSPKAIREADAGWEAALERGHRHRQSALDEVGPLLTPGEVAARLGVSTVTVNNWRRQRKLLGLRFDDHQYLYPLFQFVESPAQGERGVLRHLDDLLALLGDRPAWEQARFFLTPAPFLKGETPLDLLRTGGADAVERARHLAEHTGEMGS